MANSQNNDDTLGLAPPTSISKQIYLSIFILFFHIARGAWPPSTRGDEYKGALGVTLVEAFLALAIFGFARIVAGSALELNQYVVGITAFSLYWINCHFFVERRTGIEFEKEFNRFDRKKRISLYTAATAITVAVMALFFLSVAMSY